jgi:hypothetical protein
MARAESPHVTQIFIVTPDIASVQPVRYSHAYELPVP